MNTLKRKSMKWWTGVVSYTILFVIITVFAFTKMNFLFHGVQIKASMDHANGSPVIQIKGNAKNAVYLTLNGREIFIDRDGTFTEPIALLSGLSVVTLEAHDKFGNNAEKTFSVMYEGSTATVAYNEQPITNN